MYENTSRNSFHSFHQHGNLVHVKDILHILYFLRNAVYFNILSFYVRIILMLFIQNFNTHPGGIKVNTKI